MPDSRDFPEQAIDETDYLPGTSAAETSVGETGSAMVALKDQAVDTGQRVLAQTKETAGQVLDRAKDQMKSQMATQKDRTVDGLSSTVRALESTGQQFRNEDLDLIAGYADSFAGQVRRATDYLRERNVEDITRDVEDFARQNPSLFIGGAFVLGIALARFLKSSEASSPFTAFSTSRGQMAPAGKPALTSPMTTPINSPITSPMAATSEDIFGAQPMTAPDFVPGAGVTAVDDST